MIRHDVLVVGGGLAGLRAAIGLSAACDVAVGCRSTIVAHLGCIAHWTGRALRWDPEREEFLGDEEANRMRARAKREPWRI